MATNYPGTLVDQVTVLQTPTLQDVVDTVYKGVGSGGANPTAGTTPTVVLANLGISGTTEGQGADLVGNALKRVPSIAALRALTAATKVLQVDVDSYYGDGTTNGGGRFVWSANATAPDDFGVTIVPTYLLATSTNEVMGSGTGSATAFSGTFAHLPLQPGTLTVTAGTVTGTDDSVGNITGTGVSGTVNYATGAWTLTFTTAPASGVAITGTYQYASAAGRWLRSLNRGGAFDVSWFGAKGDKTTVDTLAISAALAKQSANFPKAAGYLLNNNGITVPANSKVEADPVSAFTMNNGGAQMFFVNANTTINGLNLQSSWAQQGITFYPNATNVVFNNFRATFSDTNGGLQAVQCNTDSCGNHVWNSPIITADRYAILYNSSATNFSGLVLNGPILNSNYSDALELNFPLPNTRGKNISINGGLYSSGPSGTGTNSGFGVGYAHVRAVSHVGGVSPESRISSLHIEDGSQLVSVVGFVGDNCNGNGVSFLFSLPSGDTDGTSLSWIGGAYHGNAAPGFAGFRAYDTSGTNNFPPLIVKGIIFDNFESGFWPSLQRGITIFDDNVVSNCNYAIRVDKQDTIIRGRTVVDNVNYLVWLNTSAVFNTKLGYFACRNKPKLGLIYRDFTAAALLCSFEGFEWPDTFTITTANTQQWQNLFAAPSFMNGILSIRVDNGLNFVIYEANVLYDGTTLTLTKLFKSTGGVFAAPDPAVQISGGQVQFGFLSANTGSYRSEVRFTGTYYT